MTTNNNAPERVDVTQADREAAADLWRSLNAGDGLARNADRWLDGSWDKRDLVQAFARHRLAHQTPPSAVAAGDAGLREALERIADPRNTHFAGDAQVVARAALSHSPAASTPTQAGDAAERLASTAFVDGGGQE